MTLIRRSRVAVGAATVASVLLGGCAEPPPRLAGPTSGPVQPTVSATPSPTADTRPLAPLTGRPIDPAVAGRSAVAVVVAGASPVGLERADVVVEEITSPVRWLALYQSQDADQVGPVAATRPADLMVLAVLRPAYAFRGGTNGMVEQAKSSGLPLVNAASTTTPFATKGTDQFAATAKVRAAAQAPAARPVLVYDSAAPAGAKPAKQIVIAAKGMATQTWTFDAGSWRRTAGGPAATVANLVVQIVPYKTIQLGRDGAQVPSARVLGTGPATVAPGPVAVTGTWSKPGLPQQTNYVDGSSVPVRLVPGTTWVVLAPTGATVTAS